MSNLLHHGPCESCGSSDANAHYDDGHAHCFSCGVYTFSESNGAQPGPTTKSHSLLTVTTKGIRSRKITDATAAKFGYGVAMLSKGEVVQVAPYYDLERRLVAQKVRLKGKDFRWLGDVKPRDVLPFGAQAFPATGKQIVVTEGEIDALSMSQVQANRWPVVSIPTGGEPKAVRRYFARHQEYFSGFERVVLMFDMDDVGREAAAQAAEILGNRAAVATLPLKDANEMLVAGRGDELIDAMWRAKVYRPEGIVDLATLRDEVLKPVEWGLSWPFESLTKLTFGIRLGELYAFGAGTGVGKTDFFTQTMQHLIQVHGEKIGVFALEQEPKETAVRLMGKLAGKAFHIPDGDWTPEDISETFDAHVREGQVYLYDSFGVNDWEAVAAKIRYLRDSEDVKYFFLDHLTALAAGEEEERKALDQIMAEMGGLVKEIPIVIFFISHLATPDGRPHEEGGRVMIRHFRGSRAIGFWSHFMFGLERDQQAESEVFRTTTTFRVLKDRYTGRSTGRVFWLTYDADTGMLHETTDPEERAESFGFETETMGAADTGDF